MGTFKVNLYFRDGVESFTVYAPNSGSITYTRSAITDQAYSMVTVSGFSSPLRVTCNLKSGYYFAYWRYRYPTATSALATNYNNPITFQYDGSGEVECFLTPTVTNSWVFMRLSTPNVQNLSGTYTYSSLHIREAITWLIMLTPSANGVLTFEATNTAFDTLCWIAETDAAGSYASTIGSYTDNYNGLASRATANVTAGNYYFCAIRSQQHVEGYTGLAFTLAETPGRPNDWAWTSSVVKGGSVTLTKTGTNTYTAAYLTAAEWNAFVNRVKEFADYKNISMTPSSYYVTQGAAMRASVAEGIRQIISSMSPSVAVPSRIYSGKGITAADINGLKNSLNSVW